jgi:hypothetical protein
MAKALGQMGDWPFIARTIDTALPVSSGLRPGSPHSPQVANVTAQVASVSTEDERK